jgi:tryptophan synthase alpha subunit
MRYWNDLNKSEKKKAISRCESEVIRSIACGILSLPVELQSKLNEMTKELLIHSIYMLPELMNSDPEFKNSIKMMTAFQATQAYYPELGDVVIDLEDED